MRHFKRRFDADKITIYPLGDWHYGSPQCNEVFISKTINEIEQTKGAYAVLMGDLIENAILGSRSDVYKQLVSPEDQIEHVIELLTPIKGKILFAIAGNHEQRTMRVVGLNPEQIICSRLMIPYKGFSCGAWFKLEKVKYGVFTCYFHHNWGGGYTPGGKVNRSRHLRDIFPSVDATFSAHLHTTGRTPARVFDVRADRIVEQVGYDYITGAALEYSNSYAEERAKPAAVTEFIKVTFIGGNSGVKDTRRQEYEVIVP